MNLSKNKAVKMLYRGLKNYFANKPVCVSFEVLNSCNLNCHHCNWGGQIEETLLTPEQIRDIYLRFKPPVVQISGGEPLLRDDIDDIFRALKQDNCVPYLILVSNAYLMTEEHYIKLNEAGVDQFSISLDFPDERHDYFRRQPGLFGHLNKLIPRLSSLGYDNIILNTAITHENYKYLREIVDLAEKWGVYMSFSAYTILRTANRDFCINEQEELERLKRIIDELIQLKKERQRIVTSEITLKRTYEFFKHSKITGCKAGKRFFVIPPDGLLLPCAMHRNRLFSTQAEMIEEFSNHNKCGSCFVAIRSMTDLPFMSFIKSTLSSYLSLKKPPASAEVYVSPEEQLVKEISNQNSIT
ncbi:hypothetical protein AMJ80_00860 [bacterium SM23_31]|nr:MAG: hypothetical protein AMJ80_00860 [bacterium SM23_31]